MLSNRQRYQKMRGMSGTWQPARLRMGACTLLALALIGCSGTENVAARSDAQAATNGRQVPATLDTPDAVQVASLEAVPALRDQVGKDANTITLITPPEARQAVIDARAARQKKQWDLLQSLVPVAKSDPVIGAYAEYWSLYRTLTNPALPVPEVQIRDFIQRHAGTYLADRLKGDWIVAATRAGNYALAASLAPLVNVDASEQCALLHAQHMTGQRVNAQQVMDSFVPNNACWAMLGQMKSSQVVGWKQLEPALRAILETNKAGNARRMAALMFTPAEMTDYAAIMKNPKKWLSGRKPPRDRAQIELVTIALSRLAYGDNRLPNAAYVENNWATAIPKDNIQWVWSQFGLVAALNVELDAAKWYRRSGTAPMTDYNHAWQVRAELRQPAIDWKQVEKAIERMTDRQASEPVWMYWSGRALAAQGQHEAAVRKYQAISTELDFYGQLASEELGHTLSLPPAPAPVTAAELREARSNPGLHRAITLFELGWRPEAVPEWSYAIRGMTDRQLRAAAELARQEHIYDRVVNTSLLTHNEIDFSQRFIAPFEGRVTEKARMINLDPAWVYGLIRQESRFIMDARSHVGASGLMQLMPATARWVAKKIGMVNFTPSSVNEFETNTILGTNYLNMVLNDLNGSEVLATAGYNAGPRRPVLWRSKLGAPVEGAIFAETIPFTETRLYVKNVMSNATYYAMLFTGQPQSLKKRLGTVSPQPSRTVDLP
ncbi:lytic transglycosylase domain-containing protein [Allopusillimonas ginsengisoli]|nr:lytic transglycosylase domain-containing protein [Allopusillimonas ginsengisoli]